MAIIAERDCRIRKPSMGRTYHEALMISRAPTPGKQGDWQAFKAPEDSLIEKVCKLAISLLKQIRFVTPQLPRYT
jgi:hypothetical protein